VTTADTAGSLRTRAPSHPLRTATLSPTSRKGVSPPLMAAPSDGTMNALIRQSSASAAAVLAAQQHRLASRFSRVQWLGLQPVHFSSHGGLLEKGLAPWWIVTPCRRCILR
jgi:hypothetical protein